MNYLRKIGKKKFGEILIEEGLLRQPDLERALDIQDSTGEMLGEILLDEGLINENDIARVIVKQYQFPFIRTAQCTIAYDARNIFPPKFLHDNLIVPIDIFGDIVTLVIGRFSALDFIDEIKQNFGLTPFIYVGLISDIRETLETLFPLSSAEFGEFDGLLQDVTRSLQRKARKRMVRATKTPESGSAT